MLNELSMCENISDEGIEVIVGKESILIDASILRKGVTAKERCHVGPSDMRWELEPLNGGTRLTLWSNINRQYIAMGAAGWHICLDVLDHMHDETPIGRTVGMEVMKFEGWQRLFAEYSKQFGVEPPSWSAGAQ